MRPSGEFARINATTRSDRILERTESLFMADDLGGQVAPREAKIKRTKNRPESRFW
jgi:hypothetical protein